MQLSPKRIFHFPDFTMWSFEIVCLRSLIFMERHLRIANSLIAIFRRKMGSQIASFRTLGLEIASSIRINLPTVNSTKVSYLNLKEARKLAAFPRKPPQVSKVRWKKRRFQESIEALRMAFSPGKS